MGNKTSQAVFCRHAHCTAFDLKLGAIAGAGAANTTSAADVAAAASAAAAVYAAAQTPSSSGSANGTSPLSTTGEPFVVLSGLFGTNRDCHVT